MTKGEAKMLETDAVVFPIQLGQEGEKTNPAEQAGDEVVIEEKSTKINIRARFVRLKKSMRKRSVSIL